MTASLQSLPPSSHDLLLFCICVFRILWVNTVCQTFHIPELLYLSWPISWLLNVVSSGILYGVTLAKERRVEYPVEPADEEPIPAVV